MVPSVSLSGAMSAGLWSPAHLLVLTGIPDHSRCRREDWKSEEVESRGVRGGDHLKSVGAEQGLAGSSS